MLCMSARALSADLPLESHGDEIVVTESRLEAHPLTNALAADFTHLRQTEWLSLMGQQWQLLFDLLRAESKVWYADIQLDKFVDKFHPALLRAVGNDTSDARYTSLMKGKRPFELKRPVLKGQLAIMSEWPKILDEKAFVGLDELLGMRPELVSLLALATDAQEALITAKKQDQNFRTIGERRVFADKHNALRQAAAGKIGEMVHALQGAALPNDFPSWFFLKANRHEEKDASSEDIEEDIKKKEEEIAELRVRFNEAKERELKAAQDEQKRQETEALLAAARQRQKQAAAEAKALEDELKKR